MTSLIRYEAACKAVAEACTFDDVRDWEDKAAAVIEYGRRAKNRSIEIDGLEIRARARRRRGELLLELKAAGRLVEGRPKTVTEPGQFSPLTLEDLKVSRNESSRDQQTAAIEGDSYERLIARCRAHMEANPDTHAMDVLRERDGPVNGARSIMGSRQEPDDSLDYFPTPPWATRALMQHVMPAAGFAATRFRSAWEPACGEGHIAEILKEYSDDVLASDVFDYGYGAHHEKWEHSDFLTYEGGPVADWIVTNPPFGDKAIQFVRRALDLAGVGVAMFFRSQWAVEGIERYEQIFRDRPPTLCAFFVERVNLCKGRWDPDGSTATAYCWLVWVKGAQPLPTFWIPPGCRGALTKPDDRDRFTANPVKPYVPHDPETGEINEQEQPQPPMTDDASNVRSALADPNPNDLEEIPAFLRRNEPPPYAARRE